MSTAGATMLMKSSCGWSIPMKHSVSLRQPNVTSLTLGASSYLHLELPQDQHPSTVQTREQQGEVSTVCGKPAGLTRAQLIRVASGMLGLMFGWATKTVLTTPLFRDVYGVDSADLGFVWLAGPLSGLVVQPVIGVISDHREGQGQRSFFFAGGTVLMAASLALLPTAGAVWQCLGLEGAPASNSKETGTGLAVVALWILDLAMNASLVAIRAVVADCAPSWQQPEANTVILISYGAGTLLGYGFGALDVAGRLGLPVGAVWKSCVDFWVAAAFLLVSAAVASVEAFRLEKDRKQQPPYLFQKTEEPGSGDGNDNGIGGGVINRDGVYSPASEVPGSPEPEPVMAEINCRRRARYRLVATLDNDTAPHEHEGRVNTTASKAEAKEGLTGVGGFGSVGGRVAGSGSNDNGNNKGRKSGSEAAGPLTEGGQDAYAGAGAVGVGGEVLLAQRVEDAECGGGGRAIPAPIQTPATGDCVYGEAVGVRVGETEDLSMKVRIMNMMLFYDLPSWLRPVCLLLFCSWVGWFAIIMFGSDWVGVNIFGGDPSAPSGDDRRQDYQDGVSWASVGLAVQAVVVTAMGCGPVTLLVRNIGLKGAFLVAIASQSACLLGASFLGEGTTGRVVSLVIFAVLGVPLALVETLPYMMVGMFGARDSHGQLLGKLNVWIVLAQLALTLCIHPIVQNSQDSDNAVLIAGSIAAAAGLVFVSGIGRKRTAMTSPSNEAPEVEDGSLSSPHRLLLDREPREAP